jgi:hypothetical protein
MTYIPSAFVSGEKRLDRIPMTFGLISPTKELISEYLLILEVNPDSFEEKFVKKKEMIQTRGGWVEQSWGKELDELAASGVTGCFFHATTGLTGEALYRRETAGFDGFTSLVELYRSNGSVFDSDGAILFQGNVVINYGEDKRYEGYFMDFSYQEEETKPWSFTISWSFKVKSSLRHIGCP